MSDMNCEHLRSMMPDWLAGGSDDATAATLSEHVERCDDCRREAELIRILVRARPSAPAGLGDRIQTAVREQLATPEPARGTEVFRFPSWLRPAHGGVAAAAVLILALGTAVIWPRVREAGNGGPGDLDQALWVEPWSGEEGIVAGAPVLEELTDEQLLVLLEELEG